MIWFEAETLTEPLAVAEEVRQNLEHLKPNVVLETMKGWIPELLNVGYRLLIAAIIMFVGIRIAKSVRKMLGRTFERMEMEVSLSKFLLSMAYTIICGLAAFAAIDKLGISSASIVAVLGSAGLALGLALQGSLSNFAGGVLILLMKPFKVGDYIICNGNEGTVSVIGLVYTTLNTGDNKQIVMPNGTLSNSDLVNVTGQEKRRLEIKVSISYDSDLRKAKEILYTLFETYPLILPSEPILTFVDELGDHGVILCVRGWVATGDFWVSKWDLTEKVKLAFDEEGIKIPFSQLEVHLNQQKNL